jgi:hypothetical protein
MFYKNGEVRQFDRKDGLLSEGCVQIYVGSNGDVWISTFDGGLSWYTGNGFFTYSQKDGLPMDLIFGIVDDPAHGDLWLGSDAGVFQVSLNQLKDFRLGRIKHISGNSFGILDGLRGPAVCGDGRPSVIRSHDGKLWWSLDQGAAVVDPDELIVHNAPGPTIIENVVADGRTLTGTNPAATAAKVNPLYPWDESDRYPGDDRRIARPTRNKRGPPNRVAKAGATSGPDFICADNRRFWDR